MKQRIFFKLFRLIDRHPIIAISSATFTLGVALGFYAYGVHQAKLEVLVPASIVLAVLTWFGSATDILGLLREWYKDKKEEQRKELEEAAKLPKLSIEYDERNKDQYCPILHDDRIEKYVLVYRKLLRIRVLNSGGEAIGCEAILKVTKKQNEFPHPTTEEKYLQWAKNNKTKINIPHDKDAFLNIVFSIDKRERAYIAYVSRPKNLDGPKYPSSVDGFMMGDYELTVTIMPEIGDHLVLQFVLHVKKEWQELSMERIK